MKRTKIIYWILNGLFAAFMIFTAIPDIMNNPDAVKFMTGELGYPLYFTPFIGVAKVLGGIAILIPGYPRIKEWAYAGLIFDLIGAAYSTFGAGKLDAAGVIFMTIFIALAFAAYFSYHKKMKEEGKPAVR